jgi:His/Glu/Gln/Arg/opine family amino acid ABC transporter permease subunit
VSILLDPGYVGLILRGFGMTVFLSVAVILLSNALAYVLAGYLSEGGRRLRLVVVAYSFFARACPLLALLFALYYGLPRVGIYLEPVAAALIGMVFSSTAYNLEFLRSGFEGVPASQREAAQALGLGRLATFWRVLTPQAYVAAAPALFSNAIQIVKGSSLASLVAIGELTAASTTIIAETYRAIQVLVIISILYLLLAAVVIALQWLYERRRWR